MPFVKTSASEQALYEKVWGILQAEQSNPWIAISMLSFISGAIATINNLARDRVENTVRENLKIGFEDTLAQIKEKASH